MAYHILPVTIFNPFRSPGRVFGVLGSVYCRIADSRVTPADVHPCPIHLSVTYHLSFVFVRAAFYFVMFQNARQDLVAVNRGSGVETASTIWAVVKWDVLYGAAYFLMAFSDNMVCLRSWMEHTSVPYDSNRATCIVSHNRRDMACVFHIIDATRLVSSRYRLLPRLPPQFAQ